MLGSPCCLERQPKPVVGILTEPHPQASGVLSCKVQQLRHWHEEGQQLDLTRKQFPQAIEKGKSRKTEDVYKEVALSMVLQWEPTKEDVQKKSRCPWTGGQDTVKESCQGVPLKGKQKKLWGKSRMRACIASWCFHGNGEPRWKN